MWNNAATEKSLGEDVSQYFHTVDTFFLWSVWLLLNVLDGIAGTDDIYTVSPVKTN